MDSKYWINTGHDSVDLKLKKMFDNLDKKIIKGFNRE